MDHFHHHDGRLCCEEVPLSAIADDVGTPAYVYSARTVRDHVRRLREAFAALDPLICYAMKANGNLALLRLFVEEGTGFDIVSGGELARVRAAGGDTSRVVFSGVGKTEAEMAAALDADVLMFNVESEEELEVLASVAARLEKRAGIAIRVNPDVDPKTHRYISTGKRETKFGVDLERAGALASRALELPSLELRGIQCHIGSQITTVEPYVAAVARTVELALALRERAPALRYLNMGGGFGIYYYEDAHVPALADYADALRPLLAGTGLRLVMEPGRVIVGNAGVLLTRVLFNKSSGDKRFVIVDAGMNDLIRPSLYDGHHRIVPVEGAPSSTDVDGGHPPCDVVGPVCESGDFLAKDRSLPPVARGDLLAVLSAGAYGYVMASNYNERPRPPEVLVDGDRYAVVRRRETIEDLLRLDVALPGMRRAGEGEQP